MFTLAGCTTTVETLSPKEPHNALAPASDAIPDVGVIVPDAGTPVALDAGPADDSCAPCATCGAYAADCAETCTAIRAALEPTPAAEWWSCVQQDPCQPERAWTCFEGLGCESEQLVGAHCDALARCSMDGRGWLDEAACRADPYREPLQWACLPEERRTAVAACLSGQSCGQVENCLTNVACQGEPGCMRVLTTRLVIDCHRICFGSNNCGSDPNRFIECFQHCDEAAFRLRDASRREVEACALADEPCRPNAASRISHCAANLQCDTTRATAALMTAEARCGAQPAVAEQIHRWSCLGEVIISAVEACFDQSPCADLPRCLQRATCGDKENCLAFLSELAAP